MSMPIADASSDQGLSISIMIWSIEKESDHPLSLAVMLLVVILLS